MDNIQVRRAMTVILLSTDPEDTLLLDSVRLIEKFVSDKLAVDGINMPSFPPEAAAENPGRPKVAPAKVQLAIELLQGGWYSHREIANRVKLKIGTVRTTLMPEVKRQIPHSLKFKRERFGAQGKFKYHLKDIRAFK